MEDRIRDILSNVLGLESAVIDEGTGMDNVESWDSLNHINVCLGIEQEFGISFEVSEMEGMRTFGDIVATVQAKV
jgi:acyl carrier protein